GVFYIFMLCSVLVILSSMILPPPISTPFPYTTLFRSQLGSQSVPMDSRAPVAPEQGVCGHLSLKHKRRLVAVGSHSQCAITEVILHPDILPTLFLVQVQGEPRNVTCNLIDRIPDRRVAQRLVGGHVNIVVVIFAPASIEHPHERFR